MCDWNFLCCNLYLIPLVICCVPLRALTSSLLREIVGDSNKSDSLLGLLFFSLNKPIFFFLSWNVMCSGMLIITLPLGLLLYIQRICFWAMDCTAVLSCGFAATEQRGKNHSSGPAKCNFLDADPCLAGCFSIRGTLLTVVWLVHQDPISLSAKLLSSTFMGFCPSWMWDIILGIIFWYLSWDILSRWIWFLF